MTAYHATHPSPYDDSCPDCAGYAAPEPQPGDLGLGYHGWGWLLVIVVLVAVIAARRGTHHD